jgi:hypothetical protein
MNSGMDSVYHSFSTSFAKNWNKYFWNPDFSWLNKYELDLNGTIRRDAKGKPIRKKWFGLIVIPAPFTDGWHLMKMFLLGFLFIAMSLNVTGRLLTDFYLFTIYSIQWNVIFNPIYYKLRKW